MKKKDEWRDNEKWSFKKWSLVKITLKYNLSLFILSFKTINPDLHYIPKSSFRLNVDTWTEEVFLWKIFVINEAVVFFSSAKVLDKSFTCSEWIFECIIGQSKKWKKKRWMKGQMIFHEMILGLITLKHSLGLLILSFETPNPGLHYVPKSPFRLNVDTWTEEVFL